MSFKTMLETAVSNKSDIDWAEFLQVCDYISEHPKQHRECFSLFCKKLKGKNPHEALMTLELLNSCVSNCGKEFKEIVCSGEMADTIKYMVDKCDRKIVAKLMKFLKKWTEEDFKGDPNLKLLPSLYNDLCNKGLPIEGLTETPNRRADYEINLMKEEAEQLKKAIELSKQEVHKSTSFNGASSSLYPSMNSASSSSSEPQYSISNSTPSFFSEKDNKEPYKVRTLYDFEAGDADEITFKAGEILLVLNDNNEHWWKGSNKRGEGLFPANFVERITDEDDLPAKIQLEQRKSVQFDEKVNYVEPKTVKIDENKIDRLLDMLINADQKDGKSDPPEMSHLEIECEKMGPLIDKELEIIDRNHASLNTLNEKLHEALNMYATYVNQFPASPQHAGVHPSQMAMPQPSYQPNYPYPYQSQPPQPQPQLNQNYNGNYNYPTAYDQNGQPHSETQMPTSYPSDPNYHQLASQNLIQGQPSMVQPPQPTHAVNSNYYATANHSQPM